MAIAKGSVPKSAHASNWNILRSRSIPSGTSGSHAVAKAASLPTDESLTHKGEVAASKQHRRPLREFRAIDPVGMKP